MMNKKSKRLFKKKYETALNDAERSASENKLDDAEKHLRQAEIYDKLIKLNSSRRGSNRLWPICIMLICIMAASGLYSFSVFETPVRLEISCKGTSFSLVDDWNWAGDVSFDNNVIRINQINSTSAHGLKINHDSERADLWIRLANGDISLKSLAFNSGSSIMIEANEQNLFNLSATNSKSNGRLLFGNKVDLSVGKS